MHIALIAAPQPPALKYMPKQLCKQRGMRVETSRGGAEIWCGDWNVVGLVYGGTEMWWDWYVVGLDSLECGGVVEWDMTTE